MLTDEALHQRLLDGDLTAFDPLYARYERPLYGFIRKHLSDRHEAEDVLHETFLTLLRQRPSATLRTFRAWLYQVARNLCLNRHRSSRRAARALQTIAQAPRPPDPEPDHALLQRQAAQSLCASVAKLPAPLGELYALRAGGLSYGDIANVLDVPLGTVKSRMHDLLSRLRAEMTS
ncbi:MAG: sigma-70 family RNA polymerase sigma factor [Deltaproteobacteria bacterium]|nr:sigma-70 family RNA polymerase sigma factor [Deltaproteobacteria bacterium]